MTKALPDYLSHGLDVVLVGINPGMRSAEKGHHFAGVGNRFWDLLFDSGLVPKRLSYEEDGTLLEHGIGLTNIVPRPSRSSSELVRDDFQAGRKLLARKIRRYAPRAVAFVGITVFREFWPEISRAPAPKKIACGRRPEGLGEAALFVVPNPSGRNAHFTYPEMLRCWRALALWLERRARAS